MTTDVELFAIERADTKPMAVRRLGRGRTVVCLAGGPGRNAEYLGTLGGLSERFELVIPDARGTGASPPPTSNEEYGFDQLAADVESLRTALGRERLTLLAHSAACTTALYYAAFNPTRLDALILVTPGRRLYPEIDDDTETILRRRQTDSHVVAAIAALDRLSAGPPREELPSLLAALNPAFYADWSDRHRHHAEAESGQVNQSARQLFGEPDIDVVALRDRLREVHAPVLVITGSLDAATGVLPGVAWAACFPNGEHRTIENCGHYPWVDRPERFRHVVATFLLRLSN